MESDTLPHSLTYMDRDTDYRTERERISQRNSERERESQTTHTHSKTHTHTLKDTHTHTHAKSPWREMASSSSIFTRADVFLIGPPHIDRCLRRWCIKLIHSTSSRCLCDTWMFFNKRVHLFCIHLMYSILSQYATLTNLMYLISLSSRLSPLGLLCIRPSLKPCYNFV